MNKTKWIGLIIIIVMTTGSYFLFKNSYSQKPVSYNQSVTISPTTLPKQSPTPLPLLSPAVQKPPVANPTPSLVISGEVRGQIICNYQTPPAPNQFGVATINSNWNNANIDVCVSVNGNSQTLIAENSQVNGSRTDNANWISSNTVYEFTLYNRYPGDPVCNGTILSTCQINTK